MQGRAADHESASTSDTATALATGPDLSTDALQRLVRETEASLLQTNTSFSAKPAEFFYATVLDAFQPRGEGVFSGDRLPVTAAEGSYSSVALCIRGLLPFAKPAERRALDMALFSLLTMYMGRLAKDSKLTGIARSAYTSAIREFREVIGSSFSTGLAFARVEHCQLFLALSTALQLFEVCTAVNLA